ncbi:type I deoxyribonuclease HsdR [Escherichia coli]|uniref:type I deoxyribonuclease HsdR n=1 Tax=Escherichia coli TaxID=562 RepID=UPI00142F4F79|nr:type I deoxyribonuclease HsdR [Escherichia coli]
MPAFEWVHVQLHQQKGMISLSPPTICNSAKIVATPQTPVLIKNNKLFHQYLIEGVPVEYSVMEQEQWVTKHTHVRLIDFVLWSTKTGHRVRVFPVSVF